MYDVFAAIRAHILRARPIGNGTRYEMAIKMTYKSSLPLLDREFVWSLDRCQCPQLEPHGEYIVMGNVVADTFTRESRLVVGRGSFVRPYTSAEEKRFSKTKLAKLNCDKYKT